MEIIFTGMSEYQKEMIFKFGEVIVTLEKQNEDEYKININPGSYDFDTGSGKDCIAYCSLKYRVVNGSFFGKNWWIKPDYFDIDFDRHGYFNNDDVFNITQINCILQSIKSSVDFIQNNGGTIKDRKIETYYAGKMKITLIPKSDNKVKIEIEGMKCWADTPSEYHSTIGTARCYTQCGNINIYSDKHHKWIAFIADPACIIRTKEEAMEIIDCLKECSKRLHDMNEPKECSDRLHKLNEPTKEKMTIKVTPVDNDMVTLEITGMGDPVEFMNTLQPGIRARYRENRIILRDQNGLLIQPDGCKSPMAWIYIGPEYPMTKDAAQEIITTLGAAAAKLHAMRHRDEEYTLVL